MSMNNVLQKVESGELNATDAYDQLYIPTIKQAGKRAFFIKIRISVPEEGKGINTFLRLLFLIPIPLIFARIGIKMFESKITQHTDNLDLDELLYLIKYSKNTIIQVESDDAQIDIKII